MLIKTQGLLINSLECYFLYQLRPGYAATPCQGQLFATSEWDTSVQEVFTGLRLLKALLAPSLPGMWSLFLALGPQMVLSKATP